MLKKAQSRTDDSRGFSLIEVMIVIAIIGLLAVIAIPNYISFRNKAYCSQAESDAATIANEVGAYFAIPAHSAIDKTCISSAAINNKTWDIVSANPNLCITITVQDDSGRCPVDYQNATPAWKNNVFTKIMHI